ncbi:MAG: RluA family pseudouridine synthase, partial [bacterium]
NLIPSIIYEDEHIIVINKPSGLVVNRAASVRENITVMDWIEGRTSIPFDKTSEFGMRFGVIHRLDKGTSGVMVIAKTREAFEKIQAQFKERKVKKEYLGLVHADSFVNNLESKFIIDAPISRNPKNRLKWAVVEGGRNAVTEFNILDVYEFSAPSNKGREKGKYVLLRCVPKTGRTHQIRVHLASINCPVVCDKVYLGRRTYKEDLKWCPRIFLHAERLGFKHPDMGEWVEYVAKLSKDLESICKTIKKC